MTATLIRAVIGIIAVASIAGCQDEARGFALPPGNEQAGHEAFVELGCNACHRIEGVINRRTEGADPAIDVRLGGQVSRVKTYGDLVTSIINPSHRLSRGNTPATVTEDGESRMPYYNDRMTVQQLVDLTAFLQRQYSVWVPEYRVYYYP